MNTGTQKQRKNLLTLPDEERHLLKQLHLEDGAWTHVEASEILGQDTRNKCIRQGLLDASLTDIDSVLSQCRIDLDAEEFSR